MAYDCEILKTDSVKKHTKCLQVTYTDYCTLIMNSTCDFVQFRIFNIIFSILLTFKHVSSLLFQIQIVFKTNLGYINIDFFTEKLMVKVNLHK
jgi:hypothetical protein